MYTKNQFARLLDHLQATDEDTYNSLVNQKLDTVNDWIVEREDLRDRLEQAYSSFAHDFFIQELSAKRPKLHEWRLVIAIPKELDDVKNHYNLVLTIDLFGYLGTLLEKRAELLKAKDQLPLPGEEFDEREEIIAELEEVKKNMKEAAKTEDIEFEAIVKSSKYAEDPKANCTMTVISFLIPKEVVNILNDKMKELKGFKLLLDN